MPGPRSGIAQGGTAQAFLHSLQIYIHSGWKAVFGADMRRYGKRGHYSQQLSGPSNVAKILFQLSPPVHLHGRTVSYISREFIRTVRIH